MPARSVAHPVISTSGESETPKVVEVDSAQGAKSLALLAKRISLGNLFNAKVVLWEAMAIVERERKEKDNGETKSK